MYGMAHTHTHIVHACTRMHTHTHIYRYTYFMPVISMCFVPTTLMMLKRY